MDLAGHAYRLIGTLPVLAVIVVGLWLVLQHRQRNPRVCMLVGTALLVALATYTVLPVVAAVLLPLLLERLEPGTSHWHIILMFQTFVFASASALIWGLVLFAIFSPGGVVDSTMQSQDDFE